MSIREMSVLVGGALSLAFFLFHTRFYHLFDWAEDFAKISARNQRILYTVHVALLLLLLMLGVLSLAYYAELARSEGLAQALCLMYSAFWLWRAVWQLAYFHPRDRKAARLHRALTIAFFALFACYATPPMMRWLGL